jgi:hypothetical protein
MRWASNLDGEEKKCIQKFCGETFESSHFKDQVEHGRMIFTWILSKNKL